MSANSLLSAPVETRFDASPKMRVASVTMPVTPARVTADVTMTGA